MASEFQPGDRARVACDHVPHLRGEAGTVRFARVPTDPDELPYALVKLDNGEDRYFVQSCLEKLDEGGGDDSAEVP